MDHLSENYPNDLFVSKKASILASNFKIIIPILFLSISLIFGIYLIGRNQNPDTRAQVAYDDPCERQCLQQPGCSYKVYCPQNPFPGSTDPLPLNVVVGNPQVCGPEMEARSCPGQNTVVIGIQECTPVCCCPIRPTESPPPTEPPPPTETPSPTRVQPTDPPPTEALPPTEPPTCILPIPKLEFACPDGCQQ